jgi:CubicO group peptidase (beta-lactamase class C family)
MRREQLQLIQLPVLLLLYVCFNTAASAQDIGAKVDEYMNAGVKLGRFSSAVLVAREGKVIVSKGYGFANYEESMPITPKTKFRLASVTKQFTAMAILILQERGKLKVEDPLCKYVEACPTAWQPITLHHLLTHTAGVPSYTAGSGYRDLKTQHTTVAALIARFKDKPLDFKPGEQFRYSNSGYALLGHTIERVSGKPYGAFLQEAIFGPLKMKDTGYDPTSAVLKQCAQGYERVEGKLSNVDHVALSVSYAAGGVYSTVEDLHRWNQALSLGKLVSEKTWALMTTPFKNNYAYGLIVDEQFGRKQISHDGGIDGFVTFLGHYPKEKLTVIVLSNFSNTPSPTIARDLAAIVFGEKYAVPVERKEIKVDPKIYDAYVGEYERQPGRNFRVFSENGRLFLAYLGRPTIELFPESETKFFVKVIDMQFSFVRDEKGQVTHLILHQQGEDILVKKVK